MDREILLQTSCGTLRGTETERCVRFMGVPFANAARFAYAVPVDRWDGVLDATKPGPACPQNRAVHEHLEHPTRRFYKREYREGLDFTYDEDCLNLNIYAPKEAKNAPVIVYFYGGGFDSGINWESPFDGSALAERGILSVFANYRVGPLGYLCHADLKAQNGREGNFGLDDQITAIKWVSAQIKAFGGDPENITLMGQSAGAISIQYLCLNHDFNGLFRRAIMLSGAGKFPKFSLPKPAEETRSYWTQYMEIAGCKTLDELRTAPLETLFDAVEAIKMLRKDSIYYTMPVVDGVLLKDGVDKLIKYPLPLDYLIGYTNNDMFAPIMAYIGNRFGRANGAYIYYFDLNAPGDLNCAFHSSDLRYVFGTLEKSWRPYGARDHEASGQMLDYLANFIKTGDPNGAGLPVWKRAGGVRTRVLHIAKTGTKMGHAHYLTMLRNMLTKGDPKA
jgi:para-nitrobenzyl esterase